MDENVKRIDKDLVLYMYIVYDMVSFLMQIAHFHSAIHPYQTQKSASIHTQTIHSIY